MVVGASAGGVEALTDLAASLPSHLLAAVFMVLHLPATGVSALPEILSRHGPLPASHVKDGEPIEPGRIYVAPPDHHLLLRTGHVHLSRGPRENGYRPAVDPMFRSAAREYAARVVGVVLSGALDDGTAGLLTIKARGGIAVVQDPADALHTGMPGNALAHLQVDHVLPVAAMGALLASLADEPAREAPGPAPTGMRPEVEVGGFSCKPSRATTRAGPRGSPAQTATACCGRSKDGGLERYRCRVGHAWSPESLLTQHSEALEAALWVALLSLEERAALARRLAEPARRRGHSITATRSRSRRTRPSRRPGWSASGCWTATASPPPGRWPATARSGAAAEGGDRCLSRRIERRMQAVGADGYLSYLDHLEVDPDELTQLFNTILINVTGSFRDPPAWEYPRGEILPLVDSNQLLLGATVNFADVTPWRRYKQKLERANQGLEDACAELQSTNEELETTNEELLDHQRRARPADHRAAPAQRVPGIDLGRPRRCRGRARPGPPGAGVERRLRGAVGRTPGRGPGQHFLNLDIGLPIDQLRPILRQAMEDGNGGHSTEVDATNRRGRTVRCRVTFSPLIDNDKAMRGLIMVVESQQDGRPAAG